MATNCPSREKGHCKVAESERSDLPLPSQNKRKQKKKKNDIKINNNTRDFYSA